MKIKNINFESDVVLAPMAGITDLPFRKICRKFHQGLMVTEMISVSALYYHDKKTHQLMMIEESEQPIALQIFTADPEKLEAVMERLNEHNHVILDINMGCPAQKIVSNGEGSALMKDMKRAEQILKTAVKHSTQPVTVKFRKGWDDSSVNAVEFAQMAESSGVDAIAIHGRTREQMYMGKADWEIIKSVKSKVKIPVIGNGDIFTAQDAYQMKMMTGCDGVMVGRGIQGNPWLLKEIDEYFKNGQESAPPSPAEKLKIAEEHFKFLCEIKGDHIGTLEMRKHAAWYFKGLKRASFYKNKINQAQSSNEVLSILKSAWMD